MEATEGDVIRRTTVALQPLGTRIKYASFTFFLQNILIAPALYFRDVKEYYIPREVRPDVVKAYPCRKHLAIRVFYPKSYSQGSGQKLPTLCTIHGGGFVLGSARDTDDWNAAFASEHNVVVVALDYAKAPSNPFPGPIHDVEALLCSALADSDLPIDTDRVALAGWSAGANLALAAAQLETVQSRIKALVPLYPVADFSLSSVVKTSLRRYKPELGGFRASKKDFLLRLSPVFDWAYTLPGHSTSDPLLSPVNATPQSLPDNVFVIACEMDMLSHEGWRTACQLAGRKIPGWDEPVGQEKTVGKGELILDDERFHFEENSNGKRYRWLLIPDAVHGFDMPMERISRGDQVLMEDHKIKSAKTRTLIGEWLSGIWTN